MEKLQIKKEQGAKTELTEKIKKSKEVNVDIPRLTSDYLDQTFQIA